MGYCVTMDICGIDIPKDKVEACLAAINELHTPENLKQASGGAWSAGECVSRNYSWVSNPPEGGFPSLEAALTEWRYDAHEDPNGNVHLDYFNGEKWGDDEKLIQAIAPFVDEGGSIEVRGEDGAQWRYLFENGAYTEQTAKISWE